MSERMREILERYKRKNYQIITSALQTGVRSGSFLGRNDHF